MGKVDRNCACCGKPFTARAADVRRGWARFCSKRCKAIDQEKRTGQYAELQHHDAMADHEHMHGQDGWCY